MSTAKNNSVVIYQTDNGAIQLHSDASAETIWATQKQMAEVFDVNVRTINEHIKNIFNDDELPEIDSVIRNFRIAAKDGKKYNTLHYNLDMIISVGYRVNSKTATKFRTWATKTLKQHITQGYTINQHLLDEKRLDAQKVIDDIKKLTRGATNIQTDDVLEIINSFTHTWFSLQSYDEDTLPKTGHYKKDIAPSSDALYHAIAQLKDELISKSEATEFFAQEKTNGNLSGILGNVLQSVFGEDAYPTIEEKAAHLLYFIIKNHPFNDGNKRSAAFAFIWFLQQADFPTKELLNPNALTALTLFIAESNPKEKERMIGLVLQLLRSDK